MNKQIQVIIAISVFSLSINTANARKPTVEPKPAIKTAPSEVDHRTSPQPGKPEFDQPPPDAVGQAPKDLKKAGKVKETSNILPKPKH